MGLGSQIKVKRRQRLEDEYQNAMLAAEGDAQQCALAFAVNPLCTSCVWLISPIDCRSWTSSELDFSWDISPDRLDMCKHPDGREWRLGYATVQLHAASVGLQTP